MEKESVNVWDHATQKYAKTMPRNQAHDEGHLHQVATVWLLSEYKNNLGIICQQRSPDKEPFAGKMIMSAAGHVQAHSNENEIAPETAKSAAYRELHEELGGDIALSGELSDAQFSHEVSYPHPDGRGYPNINQEWVGFIGYLPSSKWGNVELNCEVGNVYFMPLSGFHQNKNGILCPDITDPNEKRVITPNQFADPIHRRMGEIRRHLMEFAKENTLIPQSTIYGDGQPDVKPPAFNIGS